MTCVLKLKQEMPVRAPGPEKMKSCRDSVGCAEEGEANIYLTSQCFLESTLPISESHTPV